MSAYKFHDSEGFYFVTFTVVAWVDAFSRPEIVEIVLDSLRHCQKAKGLNIHGWVIMSNHMHLIISKGEEVTWLLNIVRDFKKFTSTKIIRWIVESGRESRKKRILEKFSIWLVHSSINSTERYTAANM